MKVLVSGATGYVGQAVVRELIAAGHTPVAAVRRGSPTASGALQRHANQPSAAPASQANEEETRAQAAKLFPAACEIAVVDWDDVETVVRAAHGCQAIIQAVGTIRAGAKYGATYEKVDYGTTLSLIAAGDTAGVERFVLLSSIGASATGVTYLKWKWRTEEAVRNGGIAWTIVRPSFITGPGRALNRVLDPVISALGLVARSFQLKYRSIDRDSLARILVRALELPPGQILEGASMWTALV